MEFYSKTCCFTGHRHIPKEKIPAIKQKLKEIIITLIAAGYQYFGAGGALGFDTIAAQTVIELKNQYPQIKLILVLPCKVQSQLWKNADKLTYEQIKSKADKIVYESDDYTKDCMAKRNRHLVDSSSVCIAYMTRSGGTAYTVNYAKSCGCNVINIAELLLQ